MWYFADSLLPSQETGLYYLQSRYYNPEMGRFINTDAFTSTGQGLLGNNMFAYCNNSPVQYVDTSGQEPFAISAVAVASACCVAVAVGVASFYLVKTLWAAGEWLATITLGALSPRITFTESEETLPRQGYVEGDPDAPPVDAGKQGKHVPGHNNHDDSKSSWPEGQNGVSQTQEAWQNGVNDPKVPSGNVRIGIASDGTIVRVHRDGKGAIHGYPLDFSVWN